VSERAFLNSRTREAVAAHSEISRDSLGFLAPQNQESPRYSNKIGPSALWAIKVQRFGASRLRRSFVSSFHCECIGACRLCPPQAIQGHECFSCSYFPRKKPIIRRRIVGGLFCLFCFDAQSLYCWAKVSSMPGTVSHNSAYADSMP
jgi:hypothetical protein